MTTSPPFSITATDAPSIQQLSNLDPGNEVQQANQSNQSAVGQDLADENLIHGSASDDDDEHSL